MKVCLLGLALCILCRQAGNQVHEAERLASQSFAVTQVPSKEQEGP